MHDMYGDGWNGGFLEIFKNGTSLGHFSASGFGSTSTISMCENDSLRFEYTQADYENENSYELYSPGWQLILKDGPNPLPGTVFNIAGHCDTINVQGNHPCTAIPIDTTQCALADNTLSAASGINPFCAEYHDGDAWFLLHTPPSGNVSIATDSGSINDTGLAVWTGPDCTSLRELGCDDDAGIDSYSFITLYNLAPNQDLYIQVWGYGGARGSFRLCVKDLGVVTLDSSELPIVSINSLGQNIINDTKINALMQIRYNGPGMITHVSDIANIYDGNIGIEIRGASSSGYPQTPYNLETRTVTGANNDVSLLSMPVESDWVLISNFNDRSLIRNTLSSKLFLDMGEYAPRMRLCEVLLDSMYKGIYVFGEKIKRDKNRVDIAKLDTSDIAGDKLTGGYILQQNYWDPSTSFQSNYSPIDHPGFDVHFVYEYPKPNVITEEQKTYIASYVDSLETALYSSDFTDPDIGYRKYLDEKSFIDYFLLNELARNNDGFKKSVFFFKDRNSKGGKLKAGPIWDFDWAWKNMYGCDIFSALDGSGWAHHINDCPTDNYSCGWYVRLFEDTTFLNNLKCTYQEYRKTIFDTTYIFNYIDSMGVSVQNAEKRHFKKWSILGISGPAPEVGAVATTYPAELDTLKSWITKRIIWLDANMPGLCSTTAVINPAQNKEWLQYSPNPTNGIVHFEGNLKNTFPAQFILYDAAGRMISRRLLTSSNISFDYELTERGLYYFIISNSNGESQHGKVIRL
ncbi:MAG: CotH kinase family protein [Saprospiraceae bacterium]|uniref:CotH kinase family protein n=1 Tax=Candidatus Opimibacter skivensis TaxID=2982028 RepID=A0A9D7SS25_9BACT|nr:CotH kinase family protein [Candidatus Opimibacter skivensis]